MCVLITVGVSGLRGDVTAPFRACGFATNPACNPTSAAMPKDAVRIDVMAGWCSCALYNGDTPEPVDPVAVRDQQVRKYARKGWSQSKIDRALEAQRRTSRTRDPNKDYPAQFAAAIETLIRQGARVTLLAHSFSAKFDEPFEILGTTELPLGFYVKSRNRFPEDMLVTIVA